MSTSASSDSGAWPAAGSVVTDQVGELIILTTHRETDGNMVEVEAICNPGLPGVEERAFARHQIRFEVLEGGLLVESDGIPRVLCAGEAMTLAPGTPHRISTPENRPPARFIWQMRPAPIDGDPVDLVFGRRAHPPADPAATGSAAHELQATEN